MSDSFIYVQFVTESVGEAFKLQGGISEQEFGYTAKMVGDVNMSSDILKLCEIALQRRK